jgi:cytochrome c peroxidase
MAALMTKHKERKSMRIRSKARDVIAGALAAYVATSALALHAQQNSKPTVQPTSLKALAVPEPPNLGDFVQNKAAAIALGKAFFWEQQVSSDNLLACASCHFHAGADHRMKNSLNPNLTNVDLQINAKFNPIAPAPGHAGGVNYTLKESDFPFHQLSNPNDRESVVLFSSNDVVSSAGVYNSAYTANLGVLEKQRYAPDGVFQVKGVATRRVAARNTPTVINAVLNFRNFWDGRANFVFNGVNPWGPRDESARIWLSDAAKDGSLTAAPYMARIPFASAASQAVGPALSVFEMSGSGRQFADIAHKLLATRPLLNQSIASTDSVLGKYRSPYGMGLNTTYDAMIRAAFWPQFWEVPDATFTAASGTSYRQIEMNFSLFWGLAIQLYEATLISDDTRFDRYAAGDHAALTAQEQLGLSIFTSERAKCVNCHKGAEFTAASTRMTLGSSSGEMSGDGPIENMLMGDRSSAIYDNGFYNIGVTPPANDLGNGDIDPFGNPLSFSREFKNMLEGRRAPDAYSHSLNPCTFMVASGCTIVVDANTRDAVDGAFKTPGLRNVELTGPYFHNGGYATLEQVVEFYNRGGNMRRTSTGDTTGYGKNSSNFDSDVTPIGLSDAEKAALVAFLKSLTDDRVRYEKAPFDHPSLKIPTGAKGDHTAVTTSDGKTAIEEFLLLPAVGATGRTTPILPFLK